MDPVNFTRIRILFSQGRSVEFTRRKGNIFSPLPQVVFCFLFYVKLIDHLIYLISSFCLQKSKHTPQSKGYQIAWEGGAVYCPPPLPRYDSIFSYEHINITDYFKCLMLKYCNINIKKVTLILHNFGFWI